MASKTDKGSWSGDRKAYQPRTPEMEAAKWIMNTARRVVAEKDPATALDEAVLNWLTLRGSEPKGCPTPGACSCVGRVHGRSER